MQRLETLEEEMIIPASNHSSPAIARISILTSDTAHVDERKSIMGFKGNISYYQIILDPRKGGFDMAPEKLIDHSRIPTNY